MLSIRLTRTGKAHTPHYRIVVQEKRSKLTGSAIDSIGHYHPADKSKLLIIDKDKARKWLAAGAQPTDTVTNLFVKEGILDKSATVHYFYAKTDKKAEAAVEVAPKVEEAPAVEEALVEKAPVAETAEEAAIETEVEAKTLEEESTEEAAA